MSDKYDVPDNWEDTCDGQECKCGGRAVDDCFCDVDWTPRASYELMIEVNSLRAILKSEGYNYD